MQGFQITFFTQQDRRHHNRPMAEWLMFASRDLGLQGATVVAASEGYGLHRQIHSAHILDLSDQPQEVVMAVTAEEADRLFDFLKKEAVHLFYTKTPVEFGVLGAEN